MEEGYQRRGIMECGALQGTVVSRRGGTHWVLLYLVEHLPHIDTPAPSTCIVPNIAAKSEANVASSSVVFHDSMSAGVKLQALQDQFLVGPMETSSPHQGRKVEAALDALMKFNDTK